MAKKKSAPVAKLAKALKPLSKKRNRGNPNPVRREPPEAYRFRPGQSGNPSGLRRNYALEISERMMRSSPPTKLCEELGIDPAVTWGEAIMVTLGQAAVSGDVSAAREVLAAMGFSGTAAKNLLIQNNNSEQTGPWFDFLRHSHGLDADDMDRVFAFMDALPRKKPVIDASYFPQDETHQLTEGEAHVESN